MGIGTNFLRPAYAALDVDFEDRGAITDHCPMSRDHRNPWLHMPHGKKGPEDCSSGP